MSASYRLFGAETSAFSIKLRSYMRYKGLEHEWLVRTAENEETLQEVARFSTLPVLVTSNGFAVHDTTPTIDALEADTPSPEATPDDAACAFLAVVLEDYADLWLSKSVMHYRWGRKKDQKEAAARAIDEYFVEEKPDNRKELIQDSIARMTDLFPSMGLNKEVGSIVEKSFKRFVKLLNAHLEKHLCIFGGRPSVADFGLAAQLSQLMKDPTPAKIIEKEGPFVKAWCEFMDDPKANGPFESFGDLKDTLTPIFKKELGVTFLPWAAANLEASLARQDEVTVTLGKDELSHTPLRSAARSFKDVRRKFSNQSEEEALLAFVEEVGIGEFLRRPERPKRDGDEGGRGRRRGRRRHNRHKKNRDGDEVAVAAVGGEMVAEATETSENTTSAETSATDVAEVKVEVSSSKSEEPKAEPSSEVVEATPASESKEN
ncbi:glutathione S-transferase family protein [Hirschia maritima]|uniref:glutathione S-transferase family protein n=1 Tax=Hirschia maritima TaxID=1121961 RepID=UPI000364CD2D|nr:glutathione S-transferase family protein [Hirschia maritima]